MTQAKLFWVSSIAACALLGCSSKEPADDGIIMSPGGGGTSGGAAASGAGASAAGASGTAGTGTGTAGSSAGAPAAGTSGTAGASATGGAGGSGAGGGGGEPGPAEPFEGEGDPWVDPAPRATCRSGDMPETGLQGNDGDVRCNLIVHGQAVAPHFLSLAWYGTART